MEKNLELILEHEKAILTPPKEVFDGDYDEKTFINALESLKNSYAKKYLVEKYGEYIKYGFPIWKRMKIDNIQLPNYKYENYFESLTEKQLRTILEYDFEGSHRKYVLLSDVFSSKGKFYEINSSEVHISEYSDEITNDFYEISDSLTLVRIIRNRSFSNNTVRILVKDGADLNLYNLYLTEENSFGNSNLFIWTENNAKVKVRDFFAGKGKLANYLGMKMNGRGANIDIKPYFLGDGNAIFDLLYLLRFVGQENIGKVKAEGALSGKAKIIFRGILDIKRGAKNVEAQEEEKCVLLSKDSTMEAIPSLLVDENEIVASHAASSAPIDSESIFYLMSRGFSEEEAKKYIINGIFESLIIELSNFNIEGLIKGVLDKYTK
ncbi:SufD family Fe-S cluster assembly protein [Thermosipho atlanticus]|uniref:Iron-regulated ABC transporter permease protein SufD n=1 Tax=Thermosipho atlanticus DSM 15807 TaxID=1123380 RepID=A0A1M5SEP0_9BACT|nr:SufD family Fe-S cluster assembly protein [Thermosipho atlanticus]SHH36905.1 Iron-regulated ABC transporter permease protein SufD [Thermosipho atlanticus DSM 15807]